MVKNRIKHFRDSIAVLGFRRGCMLLFWYFLYRICRFYPSLAFYFLDRKHKIITDYLRRLDQIKKVPVVTSKKTVSPLTIWMFWWQGEVNMPELVKACISSVKQHAGVYNVQLITKDNINDYLDIPILSKVEKSISFTNFSDYVRLSLLKNYGGGWIDATIFLTMDIPSDMVKVEFYTIRHPRKKYFCISDFRWGISFLFAKKGNKLISRIYELFTGYWEENSHILDYFLLDYCIDYIISTDDECRKILESVPYNNPLTYNGIANKLTRPFDKTSYEEIVRHTWVHKLSYKIPYKSDCIQPTFYDYVIKNQM